MKKCFFFIVLIAMYSCRTNDIEQLDSAGGGSVPVKINLYGSDYENSQVDFKGDVKSIENKIEMFSPSSYVNISNNYEREDLPVSLLEEGKEFRIVVYDVNGNFVTYRNYKIGITDLEPLMLDNGKTYVIVAYSFNNKETLGEITTEEMLNLESAYYRLSNYAHSRNFLFSKTVIVPSRKMSVNMFDISFRQKLSNIVFSVHDANGRDVESVKLSSLEGDSNAFFNSSDIRFINGSLQGAFPFNSDLIVFPTKQFVPGLKIARSTPYNVHVNSDESDRSVTFKAKIKMQGSSASDFKFSNIKFKNGYKHNIQFNFMKCGAYLGDNTNPANYKEFMCQNLGSTLGVDPFSPEAGNHGAKYQWGTQNNETGRYISQSDDQSNSGAITGWNSSSKPNGSWSDTTKTGNDPCPSGYRVPTSSQWQAVINNNNLERVGSFADEWNYTSALYIKNPSNMSTLMLPAAGYRYYSDGMLYSRGYYGHYWSSSEATSGASRLYFNSSSVDVLDGNRSFGFSVRCVAE
ncbi:TPA: FISUMP domain-containing protein [Elizabethkingia anophelis]